jgi:hypothetical protein
MNQVLLGNTLCSDGADHDAFAKRARASADPQGTAAPVRQEITAEAESVVEKLVTAGTFDAATDLANHLPVTVV